MNKGSSAFISSGSHFVGIEEIGLEIEDPFGDDPNDLPIEQICQGTKRDVAEILGVKNN